MHTRIYYVGLVPLVACYCYLLVQLLEGSLVETVPSGCESTALPRLPSTTPGPSSHTDVTSGLINIVDDVDTVVDTVGEHQTSLQALLGTSSASSFMEDLNKWRNILQTIEAVLKLWMSVQDLWCLLREVSMFNAWVDGTEIGGGGPRLFPRCPLPHLFVYISHHALLPLIYH